MNNPYMSLVGRLLLASLFLVAGTRKILAYAGTAGYMAKLGFPAPEVMAAIAIAIEVGGGILLVLGWKTRWVAIAMAIFVVIATFAAHRFWEFDATQYAAQLNNFLKNLAIIGGFLTLAVAGPGRLSVDKS